MAQNAPPTPLHAVHSTPILKHPPTPLTLIHEYLNTACVASYTSTNIIIGHDLTYTRIRKKLRGFVRTQILIWLSISFFSVQFKVVNILKACSL